MSGKSRLKPNQNTKRAQRFAPHEPRLFISQSSQDEELVTLLIDLLRSALRLGSADIRCTSVDGHRAPGGADTMNQLRNEVLGAEAFIGLISKSSLDSAYVAFELGARWGTKKHLLPLLAPGFDKDDLAGPLSAINVLQCDSAAQLHQLLEELATELRTTLEPPAVFSRHLEGVVQYTPPVRERRENAVLFDEVRLDAAKDLLKFLSKVLNREAPETVAPIHRDVRQEWAGINRRLYLLEAPEQLGRLDDRMVNYLLALRELERDPGHRPEVERQRDLAKREAHELLRALGLTSHWS